MALLLKRNSSCHLFRRLTLGGILTPPGFVQASAFGIYPDRAGIRRPSQASAISVGTAILLRGWSLQVTLTELHAQPKVSASFVRGERVQQRPSNRSRSEN